MQLLQILPKILDMLHSMFLLEAWKETLQVIVDTTNSLTSRFILENKFSFLLEGEWDGEIKINWSDLTKKSFERKIKLIFNSLSGFGLLGSIQNIFELLNFLSLSFYLLVENINMFFSLSTEGDQTGRDSTHHPGFRPDRTIGENLLGNQVLQTSFNNPQKISIIHIKCKFDLRWAQCGIWWCGWWRQRLLWWKTEGSPGNIEFLSFLRSLAPERDPAPHSQGRERRSWRLTATIKNSSTKVYRQKNFLLSNWQFRKM